MKKRMPTHKQTWLLLLLAFLLIKTDAQIIDSMKHAAVHGCTKSKKNKKANKQNNIPEPGTIKNRDAKIKDSILKNYKF
jgi:hypothetical protein